MTTEINIKKNELRNQILEERSSLSLSDKKISDEAIAKRLLTQMVVSNAKSIFCYISTAEEIDTIQLINSWLQDGKEIFIPKVEKNRELTLHQFKNWSSLSYSSFSILEPISNENIIKNIENIDLIIVPCLGSDFTCHRLGYGGGFYDTFLSKSSATTIALCRDRFIYKTIPYEIHDIQVDMILSETNVIHNEKKGVTLIE